MAPGQVRHSLRRLRLTPVVQADTAGAAQLVAQWNNKEEAAIASALAAEIYGLDMLTANVEDAAHNTTRFYVMARQPPTPEPTQPNLMTTFVFRVRNVPAALYKALGGFATNGVNMTKLESYMLAGQFAPRSSCATRTAIPSSRGCGARWRSCRSFHPRCGCWACIPPRRSGWSRVAEFCWRRPIGLFRRF